MSNRENIWLEHRMEMLWRRWYDRARALGVRNDIELAAGHQNMVWQHLLRKYGQSHRWYHDIDHISRCLSVFAEALTFDGYLLAELHPVDLLAIEIAIWFHDVIYNARETDNEKKSAQFFVDLVGPVINVEHCPDFVDKVVALIMATVYGSPIEKPTLMQKLMMDVDLSSFGAPWKVFEQDSANIRREYSHVIPAQYKANRQGWIEGVLGQERIYHTLYFHTMFEVHARSNLEHALLDLHT